MAKNTEYSFCDCLGCFHSLWVKSSRIFSNIVKKKLVTSLSMHAKFFLQHNECKWMYLSPQIECTILFSWCNFGMAYCEMVKQFGFNLFWFQLLSFIKILSDCSIRFFILLQEIDLCRYMEKNPGPMSPNNAMVGYFASCHVMSHDLSDTVADLSIIKRTSVLSWEKSITQVSPALLSS